VTSASQRKSVVIEAEESNTRNNRLEKPGVRRNSLDRGQTTAVVPAAREKAPKDSATFSEGV